MNFHISKIIYGNDRMKPTSIATLRCTKNWEETSRFTSDMSTLMWSNLYMKKSLRVGANMMSSKKKLLKQKTTMLQTNTASIERNNIPLNTSRWSQKDISEPVFPVSSATTLRNEIQTISAYCPRSSRSFQEFLR